MHRGLHWGSHAAVALRRAHVHDFWYSDVMCLHHMLPRNPSGRT